MMTDDQRRTLIRTIIHEHTQMVRQFETGTEAFQGLVVAFQHIVEAVNRAHATQQILLQRLFAANTAALELWHTDPKIAKPLRAKRAR